MAAILTWLPNLLRRRKRESLLAEAQSWPVITARLLKSTVVEVDPSIPAGTSFQDRQVESGFYFTIAGAYFGGHLRSTPLSDSEAHRAVKLLPEDLEVQIRHHPTNPDRTATLTTDNPSFPIQITPA